MLRYRCSVRSSLAPCLRRPLALVLCSTLVPAVGVGLRPRVAAAAGPAATATAEDPALVEARALYDEGKARFDTFDYEGAVDSWTKAYGKLPESETGVRNAMVYNIATAQEKAYDVDKDVQHLRQAVLLLQTYVANYKALYKKTPETAAEVQKAENRIALLQERIGRAERGEQDPAPAPGPEPDPATTTTTPTPTDARYGSGAVDGIVWTTGHNPPPDPDAVAKNRRLAAEEEKTDHMLIASYVLLSVGGVIVLGGTGAVLGGNATDSRGVQGGGYGGLALGGACLVTGAALLGIGLDRRKKARQGTLVAATPVVGRGLAGASVQVRF